MFSIQENVSLARYNTLAISAVADYLIVIQSLDELEKARQFATSRQLPVLVMGGGSNIVLSEDFAGVVLVVDLHGKQLLKENETHCWLKVAAGENWHELVQYSLAHHYYGLENLALIPGRVGAAPIQNIGAYGVELSRFFVELEAVDLASGEVVVMDAADCQFGYRDSVFKRPKQPERLIISVTLRLAKQFQPETSYRALADQMAATGVEQPTALDVFQAVVSIRQSKLPDPAQLANAGSFFKNPVVDAETYADLKARYPDLVAYQEADKHYKLAAGWLLEKDGWKGFRCNGLGMHNQQSLVMVNHGGATGAEVLGFANEIRQSIKSRFGVNLEIEPRVY
jgi:UDP-N-acetylmuramate dehydrogenase